MVDPKNGWLVVGIQSVVATIVVAIVAMGCASSQVPKGAEAGSMVQTIGDVSVARDGDASIIRLEGLVDPIYSVTTPDDPNLIVVDLVGVDTLDAEIAFAGEAQQIAAYDGVVDLVTLSTFDEEGGTPLTRVEIVMADVGLAEVFSTDSGLEIRVSPGTMDTALGEELDVTADWGDELVSAEAAETEPWQAVDGSSNAPDMDSASMDDAMPVVEVEPPPAATQLTGVSAQVTEGGVLVALQADGGIGALESFTLEDPARLVIDLPGLSAGADAGNVSVDWEATRARSVWSSMAVSMQTDFRDDR